MKSYKLIEPVVTNFPTPPGVVGKVFSMLFLVGWDGGEMGGMVGGLVVGLDYGFPLRDGNPSTMLPRCSSHMPQDDTNPLSRP